MGPTAVQAARIEGTNFCAFCSWASRISAVMEKTSQSRLLVKASVFIPRAMATPPEYAAASAAFWMRILPSICRPTFMTIPRIMVMISTANTESRLIVPSSSQWKNLGTARK